jgi:thymidylate synthase (FAD)
MKLIKPYYEIRTSINGENILIAIEQAARTCYKSEGKIDIQGRDLIPISIGNITPGIYAKSARVLIPKILNKNHEAMLEFGGMITVLFVCDRGVSHELVRHRIASFAQESTRYCNYSKGEHITFIIPEWIKDDIITIDHVYDLDDIKLNKDTVYWLNCMDHSEKYYNTLIKDCNWTPQQARSILPNSLKTEINLSANIREWRHIFKLRCSPAAHPQMRELMIPLLNEFQNKIPLLFDNLI